MNKDNQSERKESTGMFALTVALTKVLLFAVIGGALWLVNTILSGGEWLSELTRGFNLM
jgi:hypothetical protein